MPLTAEPWFLPSLLLILGLPAVMVGLTELANMFERKGNSMVGPVRFLRTYVLPAAALYLFLWGALGLDPGTTWIQITATVLGFGLIVFALSSLKAVVFGNGAKGSWRERTPRIFVDILRLSLITAGVCTLLSVVWGVNVPGFFEAMGVSLLVVGLALQGVFSNLVSGLLLQFERPFHIGDFLSIRSEAGNTRIGKVSEVNWRSTHLAIKDGTLIIPNAVLAQSGFMNFSKPTPAHTETVNTTFVANEPPADVCALLNKVAAGLPLLRPGAAPVSRHMGKGTYQTDLPLLSFADVTDTIGMFHNRLWYAARRALLHLDGEEPQFAHVSVKQAVLDVATTLHLDQNDLNVLPSKVLVEQYADGEVMVYPGEVPDEVRVIVDGRARVSVHRSASELYPVTTLSRGDFFAENTVVREPSRVMVEAQGLVTALRVPREVMGELFEKKPRFVKEFGALVDERRNAARKVQLELRS